MISLKTRISSVTTMLPIATDPLPQILRTWAPTPAAPKVWATVLSVRIAASGRSMLCFIRLSVLPPRRSSRAITSTCDIGTDNSPASSSEHRNDTPIANAMYSPSSVRFDTVGPSPT